MKLFSDLTSENDFRFVVTLVDDLVMRANEHASIFLKSSKKPFDSLQRLLDRFSDSTFMVTRVSRVLALIISAASSESAIPEAVPFVDWVFYQIRSNVVRTILPSVSALKILLKKETLHSVVIPEAYAADGETTKKVSHMSLLANLLAVQGQNTQVLYEVGFCLWLLSYNSRMYQLFHSAKVVKLLVNVIRGLIRVKVVRISLATLRVLDFFTMLIISRTFWTNLNLMKK